MNDISIVVYVWVGFCVPKTSAKWLDPVPKGFTLSVGCIHERPQR